MYFWRGGDYFTMYLTTSFFFDYVLEPWNEQRKKKTCEGAKSNGKRGGSRTGEILESIQVLWW